jgi:hypothetical protein
MDVALVLESEPEVGDCGCGEPLEVAGPLGMCPACGALQPRRPGGRGLEISHMEVEACGPGAPSPKSSEPRVRSHKITSMSFASGPGT